MKIKQAIKSNSSSSSLNKTANNKQRIKSNSSSPSSNKTALLETTIKYLTDLIWEDAKEIKEIVIRSVLRWDADIATLFLVEEKGDGKGQKLSLKYGFAGINGQDIEISGRSENEYDIDWNDAFKEESGLTASIAASGEEIKIENFEELKKVKAYKGRWDKYLYPDGVENPETGFGCLYAVPLRMSSGGAPKDTVIGVFKIERRRNRTPFSDIDHKDFDLVAEHLGRIYRDFIESRNRCFKALNTIREDPEKACKEIKGSCDTRMRNLNQIVSSIPMFVAGAVLLSDRDYQDVPQDVEDMLKKVKKGFTRLSAVPDDLKNAAIDNIKHWLLGPSLEAYKYQISWLIDREQWDELLDSFYRVIPFGTGGRRGTVGIGPNRFNPFTLMSSVQGHVAYIKEKYRDDSMEGPPSVVIVYDVRKFYDLKEIYDPQAPNPIMGLSSKDFAWMAAGVYMANHIKVYISPHGATGYISTPELSFTIRSLNASAGLNISASHNHPDDNGGKFYNQHGGMEIPPDDENMVRHVEEVSHISFVNFNEAVASSMYLSWIPADVHEKYIGLNLRQGLLFSAQATNTSEDTIEKAKIVFTPLHGTGGTTVAEVLMKAGYKEGLNFFTVHEQATSDGAFPAVPYRIPNPEVPESMEKGEQLAIDKDADLVLSCDPDADRIGVCSRKHDGTYSFLTGNEIALIITHFKLGRLKKLNKLPEKPLVVKTEVTTDLLTRITEGHNGVIIGDLLVGFKYHANVLLNLKETGKYKNIDAKIEDFIIAIEESHGILVTSEVRDKDAAGAAVQLAELASLQKAKGRTLLDYLEDIYKEYGYFSNRPTSMVMTGATGLTNIRKIQDHLRSHPPENIAGYKVTAAIDLQDENGKFGPIVSDTDRSSRDVLSFRLDNGARIIIRPSGTEPKNKVYVEVPSTALGKEASDQGLADQKKKIDSIAQKISDAFMEEMLNIIGVELPKYALRISSLVPLQKRIDFKDTFLPAFEKLCDEEGDLSVISKSVDDSLSSYGKDARGLVSGAMALYLEEEQKKASAERKVILDKMKEVFFNH